MQTRMNSREQRLAERIVRFVTAETGVDPRLDSRVPAIARARQVSMALMAAAGISTPRIGWFFGRDHSTVIHAIRQATTRDAALFDRVAWRVKLWGATWLTTVESES